MESLSGDKARKPKREILSEISLSFNTLGQEPIRPGVFLLVTGAGKRLFRRFQMEQAPHRDRHLLLLRLFW